MRRRWDALIFLALALILFAVQVEDFRADSDRMARSANLLRMQDATKSITRLESWMMERSNVVSSLAETLALMPEGNIGQTLNHLAALSGDVENTYVGFSDGSSTTPGQWSPPPGFLLSERAWFAKALNRTGVVVTPPYKDLRINRQVIAFSRSFITLDGKRAVVTNVVPTSRVRELLQTERRNYSATITAGPTTVANVYRGNRHLLTKTISSGLPYGWTITYRLNERPDPTQIASLAGRKLWQWVLEMIGVGMGWLVVSGYMRRRLKTAIKNLGGTREVRVPVGLADLPLTVEALSRDVAAYPEVLLRLLSLKDEYTADHARNVANLARKIGQKLGLPKVVLSELHSAGVLHDIGKVGIPEEILHKPGALTATEWTEMRKHPGVGAGVVREAGMKREIVEAIRDHHERLDGSGYPGGRPGPDLGQLTRIIAVADVYDAMTSDRPYRRALPPAEALKYLSNGDLFDQQVVDALLVCNSGESPEQKAAYHTGAAGLEPPARRRLSLGGVFSLFFG